MGSHESRIAMRSGGGAAAPFVYETAPQRVSFGVNASAQAAEEIERIGARHAILVGGRGSSALVVDATAEALGRRCAGHWHRVAGHVPVEMAEAARAHVRALGGDALVAVGGGSAIGMAKAIALELALPIVAVPTTYSGSEMTPIWGLTSDGVKRTGRSAAVLPRAVVYDPALTLTMPAAITASSGMNALAHAVEALYAPGRSPISTVCGIDAARVLRDALPAAVRCPKDLAVRSGALLGAYLAGAALAGAGTDLHHKLCHVLGGAYDLPHAELHAVLLPYTVAACAPAHPEVMRRLTVALEVDDVPAWLFTFGRQLGIPPGLAQIGLPPERLPEAAAIVAAETAAGPRPLTKEAATRVLAAAIEGAQP